MKIEKYQCDICKGVVDDKNILGELSIRMSNNYSKYNDVKSMFEYERFDLCPICYERAVRAIKLLLDGYEFEGDKD